METSDPIHPSQQPDCVSRDHPDPLVNDCEDLLRPEVSQQVNQFNQQNQKSTNDGAWTTIDPLPEAEPEPAVGDQPESAQAEPEKQDPDWTETSLNEVKAGLRQISQALKYAFEQGREDPRLKKFGEDVKDSFNKIGEELSDFFKK